MKNVSHRFWFYESDVLIVLKYMHTYFLKIVSRTQQTEKVCWWAYLLKNNQVTKFLKFMISSMSRTHVHGLSKHVIIYMNAGSSVTKY